MSICRRSTVCGATRIVVLLRTVSILALGVFTSLVACRDAVAASCTEYPIPWRPADGAQAAAQSELSSLSSGASLTWNQNTGTLSSVLQLSTPLPDCTAGQDVSAQVFEVLAAHPALFQFDPAEWRMPEPYDCQYLGDDELLNVGRRQLAGRPVSKDVFTYWLKRVGGVVQLNAVNGTYLPVIGIAMGDTMTACNTLTEAVATATARHTPLRASIYSQCQRTGTLTYKPKSNDVIRWLSDEAWSWEEGDGQVLMTGQRTLRVTVAPANYTPKLMSSDARCPVGDGNDFVIGFDVTFDVHTGAILSVKPGLDCVVC